MTVTNAEQREYWAREGQHWVQQAARYDALNHRFGDAMIEAAGLQPGDRVLDVGCGNGTTALEAARRVAPDGRVTGIDVSAPMLVLAQHRATEAHIDNAEFIHDDAQSHAFEPESFDVMISRFGNMFFEDPEAAFRNIGGALRPGGRLAMVSWQEMLKSQWIVVPGAAAAPHVGLPNFGPPGAPGPFAFADGNRLRGILERAGFNAIKLDEVTMPMRVGDDVEDVWGFISSLELVRNEMFAGKPQENIDAATQAAKQALAPFAGPDGVILSATAWLVTARR
jgi:SAM-dependent methyltransferase